MTLETATDDDIQFLHDALTAEYGRREFLLQRPQVANELASLNPDKLDELASCVDGIIDQRMKRTSDVNLVHELEQGEAREADKTADAQKLFVLRCARLFKLAQLNAPKPVITAALKLVNKSARGLA